MELFSGLFSDISTLNQPQFEFATRVYHRLRQEGYETWLAGGAVRDLLMGRSPHDFDLATAATPDQVEKLFAHLPGISTVAVGKQFGVMVVVEAKSASQNAGQVEVATFRKDGGYQDGRHPLQVEFAAAKEDALRRDFTVNALFMDLESGQVVDYVKGVQDLQANIIRAVGVAEQRFNEDHLRILRALRFVSQLGFRIEDSTAKAIEQNHALIRTVSRERIRDELEKLLAGHFRESALVLVERFGVIADLFPEEQGFVGAQGFCWECKYDSEVSGFFAEDSVGGSNFVDHSSDQKWAAFFLVALRSGTSRSGIELAVKSLKGSRRWSQGVLQTLFWFFEPQAFSQMRMGELIERTFDAKARSGLVAFVKSQKSAEEKSIDDKKWQEFLAKSKNFEKPEPWIKAGDFLGEFAGQDLGKVLREAYWLQLEVGPISGGSSVRSLSELKAEILDKVRSSR